MNCPHCNVTLLISSREGIEIDHCPQCRGVWLDRGELDKIIERAAPSILGAGGGRDRDDRWEERREPRREERWDERGDPRYEKKKKRKGFLDDLFDF